MKKLTAEFLETALLLATVVGSGIMGDRLAAGNVAIALLANTLATGAKLVALILTFGPISGAHFSPAVTLAAATHRGLPWSAVPGYLMAPHPGAFVVVRRNPSPGRARLRRRPTRRAAAATLLFRWLIPPPNPNTHA